VTQSLHEAAGGADTPGLWVCPGGSKPTTRVTPAIVYSQARRQHPPAAERGNWKALASAAAICSRCCCSRFSRLTNRFTSRWLCGTEV